MYREHFGFRERPFTHAPGCRFFMGGTNTGESFGRLQHLLGARDSAALVTGGPGVGKSALVEAAIAAAGERTAVARADLRHLDPRELYAQLLPALGTAFTQGSPGAARQALREAMNRLEREDRSGVLCLDLTEITPACADALLDVVNLAGEHGSHMNLVLMGPHTLQQQLDAPALIQLRQRIALRHRVRSLSLTETDRYIRHQVEAAGGDPTRVSSHGVAVAVFCFTSGVPRLINTLLDATLSEACLHGIDRPDGNLVRHMAESLGWKPNASPQAAAEAAATAPARSAQRRPGTTSRSPAPAPREQPARSNDSPPPSELTLRLRAEAAAAIAARQPVVAMNTEAPSPTAALFGHRDKAPRAAPARSAEAVDTGATGMLRLEGSEDRATATTPAPRGS